MSKKKFATTALDLKQETYIVYVKSVNFFVSLSSSLLGIHLSNRLHVTGLILEKAFTMILASYNSYDSYVASKDTIAIKSILLPNERE